MPFHFSVTAAAATASNETSTLLLLDEAPVFVGVHVAVSLCWCRYSLGTVINVNNSNNDTTLAITTTTNNYVHLILLSSCLALLPSLRTLCRSFDCTFLHSRLFNTDLLGFFFLFKIPCSACYCWYCCSLVVPVD